MPRVVFALSISLLLAACSASHPRLMVVVDGEQGTPRLASLLVRSVDADGLQRAAAEIQLSNEGARIGPVSFVVEPRDASRVARISIEARDSDGATRRVRAVRVVVPEGSPRTLWVELERCCEGTTSCGANMTCRGGACVSDEVRSDELLVVAARDELRLDASVGLCVGHDASVPDGGTIDSGLADGGDGGACPVGCACEASCSDAMCSCTTGCGCAFDCMDGSNCTSISCSGRDTTCTVDATGASNVAAVCSGGARCEVDASGASTVDRVNCLDDSSCTVDCTDASNCRVRCRGTSQCLFRCASPTNCDLMCMSGAVTDCGGGLQACNRACP